MRQACFCICINKDADQLCSNCAADQRLCLRYMDSTIPLLSKSEMLSLLPTSMVVQLVSYLVRNPEDRFSQDEAHIMSQVARLTIANELRHDKT